MTADVVAAVGTNWCAGQLSGVGKYKITVVNEEFSSSNEYECGDEVAAREHAVRGAFAIATEELAAGKPYFGAHIVITEKGEERLQLVISAGASPLTNSG